MSVRDRQDRERKRERERERERERVVGGRYCTSKCHDVGDLANLKVSLKCSCFQNLLY